MKQAAAGDGVVVELLSAFRSVERQAEIVRAKLGRGQSIDEILTVLAPPGFSEHHTGRAIDVGTPGCKPLEVAFEQTPAFAWLERNAARFGFRLSFPRGNPFGYQYEPWHWCFGAE
jgi:D-alanyl-D-alanine carboxypeptidase